MKTKHKIHYKESLSIIGLWMLLMYLYYFVVFWGPYDYLKAGLFQNLSQSWIPHVKIVIQSLLFGILFVIINIFLEKSSIRKKSFGHIIGIKSLLYIVSLVIVVTFTYIFFYLLKIITKETLEETHKIVQSRFLISIIVYVIFSILLINFILQVSKKFGPGILYKLLRGKYHQPRDENIIIMFIDLKGSTTIAEKLGHTKYSQFIRNCFHDLNDMVVRYNANIYQYVGDEVVLYWDRKRGLKNLNCLKTFFAFEKQLNNRRDFYLSNYGFFPEFKAGIDMGDVTVMEIGEIKREIAFHGDVVNTASRIQEYCKKLNEKILISEYLEMELKDLNGFRISLIEKVVLHGKEKPIKLYNVEYIKN